MALIEIGNIYSKVSDLSARALIALDDALSAMTPGYEYSPTYMVGRWDGKTRFLKKGKSGCKFPTGLLTEAYKTLSKFEEVEIDDTRNKIECTLPENIVLLDSKGSITLRDYQYTSVKNSLDASRGVINIATNGGKTEIACGIIQCIVPNLKTGQTIAFFTHSKEIFTQSHKRLEERLGIPVGMVGNGKWDVKTVNLVMIPTLSKHLVKPKTLPKTKKKLDLTGDDLKRYEKEQWDTINEGIKRAKDFMNSIVAFLGDEVHHASSTTWYDVFMGLENAYFRFGLTGTVDEGNEINVKRLMGCTGRITVKVSNKYLIEKGYSAKPTIYMMKIGAEPLVNVSYQDARKSGIINCDTRNDTFIDKIVERAKSGKQCLIIANETEHGEILFEGLKQYLDSVDFSHGKKTTKHRDDCLNRLKEGSLQVLVATTILDEGVDVSGINCLFLVAGGKSMRQLLQRIGRGLRKKEDGSGIEVYDALDYHNQYLVEHTLERYNTYVAEGFSVVKL